MDALRAAFDAERVGETRATVQYLFTGAVTGACYASVADGALLVAEGRHPAPTVAVTTDFELWKQIIAYHHDPLMAYQEGLFTVEGDMETLLESDTWFRR
jgi:putative sterol carrier protein